MTISNLVESAVNLAEKVTGKDIDGDGDTGVGGNGAVNTEAVLVLPVLSSTTPKVSILTIGNQTIDSAVKLEVDALDQTKKFQGLAKDKASFMLKNYQVVEGREANTCTFANGTGVRLEIFKDDSTGLLSKYTPPSIIEPGEIASFLVVADVRFQLKVNIQSFQGPVAPRPGSLAGWVRGDANKTVTLLGVDASSANIDAFVQVAPAETPDPKMYRTRISLKVSSPEAGAFQIEASQIINKTPVA